MTIPGPGANPDPATLPGPEAADLAQACDQAALGMALVDPGGRFLWVNRHLCEMLGHPRAALAGAFLPGLIHPQDRPAAEGFWRRPQASPRVVEQRCRYLHAFGHELWVLVKASQVRDGSGGLRHIFCLFMDITQERRAEQALIQSEQEYRTIFETAGNPVIIMEEDTTVMLANEEFVKLTGVAKDQLEGKRSWTDFIAAHDVERMLGYHRLRRVDPAAPPRAYEAHVLDHAGQLRDCLVTVALIPGTRRSVASLLDMTGRKKAEAEREVLAAAIAQAAEGVVVSDPAGRILYANPAAQRLCDRDGQGLEGWNLALAPGPGGQPWPEELWLALTQGRAWAGRHRVGEPPRELVLELGLSPVRDEGGAVSHFALMLRDVSQEDSLQAQLRQAQKMEAIGTLAGGIAHDFNNILASILGYSEIVLHDLLPEGHPAQDPLREVIIAARRARDLTDRILTFSRKGGERRQPVDPAQVVREAMSLLRASLPATIGIRTSIDPAVGLVLADPTQLHQVALNLGTNAGQAMSPGGGVLSVDLSRVSLGAGTGNGHPALPPGDYALLVVSDTGPGIAPPVLERIFEPYFTTKGPGQGTGLGLAMVHGIVTGHGGAVEVDSRPQQGTSFRVWLPLAPEASAPEDAPLEAVRGQGQRVWVVDDEAGVAAMLGSMLSNLGYRARVFSDPLEAWEAFLDSPGEPELLVSDQTMPGLTGAALATRVLGLRPDLPVILCSGYSGAATPEELKALGVAEYLAKPVERARLTQAVHLALQRRA
ncbi:MAG: PAS domain S-box protein [Desulfarculus sp.]|nr:PAS domain S-box protein [Desulfarculus sp.]